jgi:hypothetical protein
MSIYLHNKEWSPREWIIFDSNINILINRNRLKKREFNDIVGVKNFFRRDRKRVSRRVINKICKEFDVNEDWLETDHIIERDPGFQIRENNSKFIENTEVQKISRAFTLLSKIYESGDNRVIDAVFTVIKVFADIIASRNEIDSDDGY